jgi:hypothetical protein
MRLVLAALTASLLAACASPPPVYGPASQNPYGVGYDQVRIENDRWRITYTARGQGAQLEAERLVLRRAADLTVRNGYEWFEVVDRRTQSQGETRPPVRVGGSVSRGWGSRGWSGTSVGVGVALSPGEQPSTTATIEIIAGRGEPVPDGAYNAAALLQPGALW